MPAAKKQIRPLPTMQVIAYGLIALLVTSCVSYKAIPPGSIDHLSGPSTPIVPGNRIRIIMKSGEEIKYMKVTGVDSEKIVGIVMIQLNGYWNRDNKQIMMSDIQSIKKQKFSAGKTVGLVAGVIIIPVVIFAIALKDVYSH